MACLEYNPCSEPTCNECNSSNPCYDNCGCLNPTDWACINNPGSYPNLNISNTDNGVTVLEKINTEITELQNNEGLIKSDLSNTCLRSLYDIVEAGENIAITKTGTGCNQKIVITGGEGIGAAGSDVNVKISATDTTTDFLNEKILVGTYVSKTVLSPGGNEKLRLDVIPSTLVSSDIGNMLTTGTDNKLKTIYTAPDGSETKVSAGSNVTVTGTGRSSDPYVISVPVGIFAKRSYFDGVWKPLTFTTAANPSLTLVSQSAQYRLRFDGTIEMKGNVTYNIAFSNSTGNKIISNVSSIPTGGVSNLAALEIDRTIDAKNVVTFDSPTTINTSPNIFGYTVRIVAGGNIWVEFLGNTSGSKTIVLSLDGIIYHPNI